MSDNAVGIPLEMLANVPANVEMAAMEMLGPLARRTVYEAPIKIMVALIVRDVLGAGLDPKSPEVDAWLAGAVLKGAKEVLMLDRSEQDADLGIKPLRAHRRRSVRERRKVSYGRDYVRGASVSSGE